MKAILLAIFMLGAVANISADEGRVCVKKQVPVQVHSIFDGGYPIYVMVPVVVCHKKEEKK